MKNGFKVAVGSRSGGDITDGKAFPVKVDVSNPGEITSAFKVTEKNLGYPPNVVIYNGTCSIAQQIAGLANNYFSRQSLLSARLRLQAIHSLYHMSNTLSMPYLHHIASLHLPINPSSRDMTAGGLGAYPALQNSLNAFRTLSQGTTKVCCLSRKAAAVGC